MSQILYALDIYTDDNDDMPKPAGLIAILNPEKPKITTASFIAAQTWLKNNNYPICSEAENHRETVRAYEAQENEAQENFQIECTKIAQIVENSVKRIEG